MRIIGIVGIEWDPSIGAMWQHIGCAFKAHYPESEMYVEETLYSLWNIQKMKELVDHIVQKHDTGEDVLLVGHSMGGVLACAAASRFKKSVVRGVVTIFSPHGVCLGIFPRLLGTEELKVPVVSFGAWYDHLVPWGTEHPQSCSHTRLWTDHYQELYQNKELARQIADVASATINKARRE